VSREKTENATVEEVIKPPMADEEFSGNKRVLCRWEAIVLAVLCIGFTLFHLFVLNVYSLEPLLFRAIHVGWGGALGFMLYAPMRRAAKIGVPHRIVVGERGLDKGVLEHKGRRDAAATEVAVGETVAFVKSKLGIG